MKHLLQLNNKKGVSLLISYVLLITIAITLSILVYNWLRWYLVEGDVVQCKEGVSLVIQDYECESGDEGWLTVTLKNKGRFNVGGYVLKVHDRGGAEVGVYTFDPEGSAIETGKVLPDVYYLFSDVQGYDNPNTLKVEELTEITLIEVQPFIYEDDEQIFCEKVSSQSVDC